MCRGFFLQLGTLRPRLQAIVRKIQPEYLRSPLAVLACVGAILPQLRNLVVDISRDLAKIGAVAAGKRNYLTVDNDFCTSLSILFVTHLLAPHLPFFDSNACMRIPSRLCRAVFE